MIDAVFLCDTNWEIKRIRQCAEILSLHEGEFLTACVTEKEKLQSGIEEHYAVELTFTKSQLTIPAMIDVFKEGSLVILARVHNDQDFLEVQTAYAKYLEWAKMHLLSLYHNEYYLIQQMNNQLVDAKRRLSRSNRQLEHALEENKEINEKLDQARILAERASQSKTTFLANMSHDIRTPMNAIVGLCELMGHHLHEPEVLQSYITKMQSSSRYLLDLINDILDLSKIENGSMKLKMEPMDIGSQIEQVVTIIRPKMTEKGQKFQVVCEDTKFSSVSGDPVRFRQILMNILSNAVKYTPQNGCIRLEIRKMSETMGRLSYRFIIQDSGIGMTEEFVRHIFEPFARADRVVGEIQGTGLGMAITKSIVDVMGGRIQVDSTPKKGSTFTVDLSFAIYTDKDRMETAQAVAETRESMPADLHGMRFLCAEDNTLNAEILESMLEMEGAACVVCENGKQLAETFESSTAGAFTAILTDIQMPVMDGYEATRQIRSSRHPLAQTIPIIAMTANAFQEDVERSKRAGMDAHITKPLNMKDLRSVIASCCTLSGEDDHLEK